MRESALNLLVDAVVKNPHPMKKYRCTVCEYIYDPALGDPEHNVDPGTSFDALPDDWTCPICGEGKWAFEPLAEQQ